MKFLRAILDKQARHFEKGGKLEKLHPLWEANDTFLFTPGKVTEGAPHVRDGVDLKRIMIAVVVALIPCILMAMYNTGYQANVALAKGAQPLGTWRDAVIAALGIGYSPGNVLVCFFHGALYFVPVLVVTYAVGGGWEVVFAIVRKHEVNEGFLVTGMLFPLILPPTIPLWQVALGISFGVVIGKEIFGGTGMNIWNPALTSRIFLFFSYPGSFDKSRDFIAVDGYTNATWLLRIHETTEEAFTEAFGWLEAFLGFIHGAMGETSTLACLLGAALLIVTGVGAWRIMAGVTLGTTLMVILLNLVGSETDPAFGLPFYWHFVLGSWAFGTVFMATDPVTSPYTNTGRWIYGLLIGVFIILVRVVNPAFPEGVMLSILLMNVFASLIDHFVVQATIKRRLARYAA